MKLDKIIPFLWVTDNATEDSVKTQLNIIKESGQKAFCIESRIFSDFCGQKWWALLDFILDYAKKNQMHAWLLDDKHYPTGVANGALFGKDDQRRQCHVALRRVDAVGPLKGGKFILFDATCPKSDRLIATFLVEVGKDGILLNPVDITDKVVGNFIYCDLPVGHFAILSIIQTTQGEEIVGYIDTLNDKSVDLLIEQVYKPHCDRYKKYFGNTFVGFFSDEPRIGNWVYDPMYPRPNIYGCRLGLPGMTYPWNEKIECQLLAQGKTLEDLLSLWYNFGDKTAEFRNLYMNIVTDAYSKNFPQKLSAWCHERGVCYTGHVIEDMGCHTKLGAGVGHFFKAMKGADISSFDIVLHQLKPYAQNEFYAAIEGAFADPRFFTSVLPKLASSDAEQDENKEGRALCEIFGAFGWGESVKNMRWFINLMLSSGINHFIPHAYSPYFPNPDCPPHFGVQEYVGKEGFNCLMRYSSKMGDRFSGGRRIADVAVMYNPYCDWVKGEGGKLEEICWLLDQNQISYDILPEERLLNCQIENSTIMVGKAVYKSIISWNEQFIPEDIKQKLDQISATIKVLSYNGEDIISKLESLGLKKIVTQKEQDCLRVMRYKKQSEEWLLFNYGSLPICDKIKNDCYFTVENPLNGQKFEGCGDIPLELGAGEVAIISFDNLPLEKVKDFVLDKQVERANFSTISYLGETKQLGDSQIIEDINAPEFYPDFSGKVICQFESEGADRIEVDYSGEYLKATVGKDEFITICSPAVIDIPKGYRGSVRLETATTLANATLDFYSKYAVIEKVGYSSIKLLKETKNEI